MANPEGGLLEVIQPGVTGFLAEKDQVGSFAAQTSRLLDDDGLRRAMGQRGRALVAERFSLERMVADYEALYREIAGQA